MVGDGTFERALVSSYRLSIHISYQLSSARHFRSEFLAGVANPNLGKGRAYGGSGGSRICQEQTMVRAQSASLNGRLGAESPSGSRSRAPGGGSRGQSPLKSFLSFSYKKWPKVKDLNEKLPPCLRQTA